MSKHLDSGSSQSEERDGRREGNRNDQKSAVRYPEDSDIDDSLKRKRKGRYSEDDDYVAYKNVDPLKQNENGIGKRRSAPRSGKEIEEKL